MVNMDAEMLEDSPSYDRSAMATAGSQQEERRPTVRTKPRSPLREIQRDGYNRVEATDVSTEILIEKNGL